MDLSGYSSDSTYCSSFELSGNYQERRNKGKIIKSTTEELKKIRNMVDLHIQDKYLLGIHDVEKYMKQLSRMPLITKKHNIHAEELKCTLYQIHKFNKLFEKTISNCNEFDKPKSDSYLDCGLTQDFKMMKDHQTSEPKPMLLPLKNASEPASFYSDMLSNKMFIEESSNSEVNRAETHNTQSFSSKDLFPTNEEIDDNKKDMDMKTSTVIQCTLNISDPSRKLNSNISSQVPGDNTMNMKAIKRSNSLSDTLTNIPDSTNNSIPKGSTEIPFNDSSTTLTNMNCSSQNPNPESTMMDTLSETEIYFETCSQVSSNDSYLFKIPPPKSQKKYPKYLNCCKSNTNRNSLASKSDMEAYHIEKTTMSSQEMTVENGNGNHSKELSLCPSKQEDELTSLASEIINMQESLFPKKELFPSSAGAPLPDPEEKVNPPVDFDAVKKLGSAFNKCYNDKLATLHCDVGTGTRSWDEVHEELDYLNALANKTTDALSLAFDNIHLDEKRAAEREYRETIQKSNFHNFDEKELKALEWEDFLATNEARLAELSTELKRVFFAENVGPVPRNYFDDEDFSDLDWRNYNKE